MGRKRAPRLNFFRRTVWARLICSKGRLLFLSLCRPVPQAMEALCLRWPDDHRRTVQQQLCRLQQVSALTPHFQASKHNSTLFCLFLAVSSGKGKTKAQVLVRACVHVCVCGGQSVRHACCALACQPAKLQLLITTLVGCIEPAPHFLST